MKIADLYIRVSIDEQADKGYSQRNQEEALRKYCQINSLQVGKVIFEDYSAKTFNRPRWNELLLDFKKIKTKATLLIFTKWDRFSRNAGDAYQMINLLRKFGVEPQAIEQPLDLSIPENKMMLAIYLAAPEVENDRRALNVFYGMRRAKKEGRWMATAPIGYVNRTDEFGRKYISPKENDCAILKWAFQQIANGIYAADQIRKEVNLRGLKCSRSNFWNAIRNPVYCGKILVKQFKEEESIVVPGQHEAIISDALFYEVQDMLAGRKRKTATQISGDENMPLRGFLICPKCGRMLTGSASKGQYNYYYYYHCVSTCGRRFRADNTNNLFLLELKKFALNPGMRDLYVSLLKESFQEKNKSGQSEQKNLLSQIDVLNERLKHSRELLADNKIDSNDYAELKKDCTAKITTLEAKLAACPKVEKSIDDLLQKAIGNLSSLDILYAKGSVKQKRQIISSIYPEKLSFDGFQYRTLRLNEAVRLIYTLGKGSTETKNRKKDEISPVSGEVVPTRIELVSKV
ncbi:recombinase family protein [Ferruginibacter sp.]|uniref:recombinase family protein n=1 Tax=Ferruginibacter sp. TaxID=1940288 RepID=UPI00374DEB31